MAPEVRGDRLLIRHPGRRAPRRARGRERLIEGGRLHPNEATANATGALSGRHSGATERSRVSRRNSREKASSCPPSFAPRRFDRNLAPPNSRELGPAGEKPRLPSPKSEIRALATFRVRMLLGRKYSIAPKDPRGFPQTLSFPGVARGRFVRSQKFPDRGAPPRRGLAAPRPPPPLFEKRPPTRARKHAATLRGIGT